MDGCIKPDTALCSLSNLAAERKPQTNGDWLRSLDDEALAEWLAHYLIVCMKGAEINAELEDGFVKNGAIWLRQPHESEVDNG